MQDYISLPTAAKTAGVPVRTLRYWVTSGKISARKGKRGYLVRLTDVQRVAALSRNAEPTGSAPDTDTDTDAPEPAAVSLTARAQLSAVMEEWVTPLMDRIAALERENGQLQERVETVTRERDVALAGKVTPTTREDTRQSEARGVLATDAGVQRSFWQKLFRFK